MKTTTLRNVVGFFAAVVLIIYALDESGIIQNNDWLYVALGVPVIVALLYLPYHGKRKRRNKLHDGIYCHGCGYDISKSPKRNGVIVCPECGQKS